MNLIIFVRWLHIISGAAWLGEVLTINIILIPSLKSLPTDRRPDFIQKIFPLVFRMASVIPVISIGSGLWMSYMVTGWTDVLIFLTTRWGLAILIGGAVGFTLTIFHFTVERRLGPIVSSMN